MQLLVMVAIMLGAFLLVSIAMMVAGVCGADLLSGAGLWCMQTVTEIAVFAVPLIVMVAIYYKGRGREFCRLDFSGQRWRLALAGVVVLLLLVPIIEWLTTWNDSWDLGRIGSLLRQQQDMTEGMLEEILNITTVGGLLANLVVVALVPAVCEELFFRAGMQNLLQRWWGNKHVAIWVTAVIFSLCHGEIFSFMPRLALGALMGYVYVYGGSLLPNVMVHFVNNSIVVVLSWLAARGVLDIDPEQPIDFGAILTVCCTLAAVGVMLVTFFKKSAQKEGKKGAEETV